MGRVTMISHLFVAIMVVVSVAATPGFASNFNSHYTLNIGNNIMMKDVPVVIHCYTDNSGSHDLGEHTLWNSDEWTVTFKEKFFGLVHYWCQMRHGNQYKDKVVLYDSNTPNYKCYETFTCYWEVRDDGFYFSGDNRKTWVKYTGW
ncbi:hypothetical protein QYF36_023873 [Acer negundo]|nr:hypothetical protein QYF36_023873 [Acer negundo]